MCTKKWYRYHAFSRGTRTDSEVRCKEIEIPSFVYPRSNINNMSISGILIYKYIDEVTKVEGRRAVSSIYRHI